MHDGAQANIKDFTLSVSVYGHLNTQCVSSAGHSSSIKAKDVV